MNDIFKALAHPARREIIAALRDGPKTSGEIAAGFDVSWPTITAHLQILRDAGLISSARSGASISYRLEVSVAEETIGAVMELLRIGDAPSPRMVEVRHGK